MKKVTSKLMEFSVEELEAAILRKKEINFARADNAKKLQEFKAKFDALVAEYGVRVVGDGDGYYGAVAVLGEGDYFVEVGL